MSTIDLPSFNRGGEAGLVFRAESFDESRNTIDIVWTTGARVRRVSYFDGAYDEELEVSAAAIRLDRLNRGAPFLNTHASYDLGRVLGSVVPGTARIAKGEGLATILLSRRPDVAGIVQDIRDGVIRNISCGYRAHKVIKEDGAEGDVALWRVVDWEPLELSAVPIGADAASQIRSEPTATEQRFACSFEGLTAAEATSFRMRMRHAARAVRAA
ncbi:hypothetical protein [Bosea sp. (in: a-proteobacteria)]